MKLTHISTILAFAVSVFFAQASSAANLNIQETASGVVFAGDGNFTLNDWGGLISSTQTGLENASFSAYLYNPNGGVGSEIIAINDPHGSLSDVLSLSFDGSVFSATFCSNDGGNSCSSAGASQTALEDASGNFSFGTSLDPNMSINGNSNVAAVPEPESYAMLLAGLGLMGFMARHRKQKEAA